MFRLFQTLQCIYLINFIADFYVHSDNYSLGVDLQNCFVVTFKDTKIKDNKIKNKKIKNKE